MESTMKLNKKFDDQTVKSGPVGTTYSRVLNTGRGGEAWSLAVVNPNRRGAEADLLAARQEVAEAVEYDPTEGHYEVKGLEYASFGGDTVEVDELPTSDEVEDEFAGWGENVLADLNAPARGTELANIRPSCLLVADQEVADVAERLEGSSYAMAYGEYTPTSDDIVVEEGVLDEQP